MNIDKQVHRDEFRLRLLVTNGCNEKCSYCLNDFQDKPTREHPAQFLSIGIAMPAISSYIDLMGEDAVITFSGGEPGLWRYLPHATAYAKKGCSHSATVKVCTNGLALKASPSIKEYVDKWHVHLQVIEELPDWLTPENTVVQYVVDRRTTVDRMKKFAEHYDPIPVKFFVDYFDPDKSRLYEMIAAVSGSNVSTRHTGVQENRGPLCEGCTQECVTLKGVWVFPDGTASTCPQGMAPYYNLGHNGKAWYPYLQLARRGHAAQED